MLYHYLINLAVLHMLSSKSPNLFGMWGAKGHNFDFRQCRHNFIRLDRERNAGKLAGHGNREKEITKGASSKLLSSRISSACAYTCTTLFVDGVLTHQLLCLRSI